MEKPLGFRKKGRLNETQGRNKSVTGPRLKRVWLDDQIASFPELLKPWRKSISRMVDIESPHTDEKYPLAQPDTVNDKEFFRLLENIVVRWERVCESKFGPLVECIEHTNAVVYRDLACEKLELRKWMDKCHAISSDLGTNRFYVEARKAGVTHLTTAMLMLHLDDPKDD